MKKTMHLDLGCGAVPRNPYKQERVFGVDILDSNSDREVEIRGANLSLDLIPFEDNYFDSVSAYDFLEHIPRILPFLDNGKASTRFPFVELMNEIWRVLIHNGLFYAQTPCFPHSSAFQDPTHVNILTRDSHIYFTQPNFLGRMYGFVGDFEVVRVMQNRPDFEYEPLNPSWYRRQKIRQRVRRGTASHLIWEFRALKNQ